MTFPWFKRAGSFYFPVHPFGFVLTLGALAFLGKVFWAIDRQSHPFAAPALVGLLWSAARTSGEASH